ncbi:hypothetical protein COO09_05200 [Rhizorhabdus dicambivorans]|uniref:Uncharacterized protein n=1 Tax=Rhizorhabdus dicambivorans TaxID=1850238 RepID=A0A2A4G0F0_9SPHN|nr:hypothetical protein CMV14_00165 [Rhizorhabdus dicambivorans]PCE43182.1 hypothetical protein COO09_05200 [Rhizorhabdus dicambivorans]
MADAGWPFFTIGTKGDPKASCPIDARPLSHRYDHDGTVATTLREGFSEDGALPARSALHLDMLAEKFAADLPR